MSLLLADVDTAVNAWGDGIVTPFLQHAYAAAYLLDPMNANCQRIGMTVQEVPDSMSRWHVISSGALAARVQSGILMTSYRAGTQMIWYICNSETAHCAMTWEQLRPYELARVLGGGAPSPSTQTFSSGFVKTGSTFHLSID